MLKVSPVMNILASHLILLSSLLNTAYSFVYVISYIPFV